MLRPMLRSKIHRAVLTRKDLSYHGSITLHSELMAAAGIVAGEFVQVVNINSGARLFTYVIEGDEPGQICLNGGAARLGEVGDLLIVMSIGLVDDAGAAGWTSRVVEMSPDNTVAEIREA